MASLRLKYARSRSPPERDAPRGAGGRRVGDLSNNQVLEQIHSRNQPSADLSALQARKEIEHK